MIREFLLLSLGLAVFAEWELVPFVAEKRASQYYCGDALTQTLTLVCDGIFNSPFHRSPKKSYDYPSYPDRDSNDIDNEKAGLKFPFTSRSKALSILEFRRIKRGVTDECCRKSCNIHELRSYCGRNE